MNMKRKMISRTQMLLLLIMGMGILAARSGDAHADSVGDAGRFFVDAITLCPAPNNPLENGLHALKGNLFLNINVTQTPDTIYPIRITADAVMSLHAMNRAIMAPDRFVGKINLEMGYETASGRSHNGGQLYCNLDLSQVE